MFSVYSDPALLASARPTQIIVGQYIDGQGAEKRQTGTEYLLFQCIPCEDVDVVAEQMDCIEEVLPTSLQVLGVYTDAPGRRKMDLLLKEHHSYRELIAVEKKDNNFVAYQFYSKQSFAVVLNRVEFSQFDCCAFSLLCSLPVLLTTADAKETAVGLDETVALEELGVRGKVLRGRQLGAPVPGNCVRCTFPLVLSPQHTRGCDIFMYMRKYVERAQRRGAACVQVQSNTFDGLVFSCLCDKVSAPLSEELWETIREMVSDAVGETVVRKQLIGAAATAAVAATPVAPASEDAARETHPSPRPTGENKQLSKGEGSTVALCVGAVIVLLAIAVLWFRS